MSRTLYSGAGGHVHLPDPKLILVGRRDGAHLVVTPPREVWERTALSPSELVRWCFLVAATAQAMLETLPQIEGGCINYWDAGNWALNEEAEPRGRKTGREYRKLHMHLLGRSPNATDPSLKWGEAPKFPEYADRYRWSQNFENLNEEECGVVVRRLEELLDSKYRMDLSFEGDDVE